MEEVMEGVLRIKPETPRLLAYSILRGRIIACHKLLLEVENRIYKLLRRRLGYRTRTELELILDLLHQAIKIQQSLLEELRTAD